MSQVYNKEVVVTANPSFYKLLDACHKQGKGDSTIEESKCLLAFDPGETTGIAYYLPWEEGFKIHLLQLQTKNLGQAVDAIKKLYQALNPKMTIWVIEDYRVYGWKSDQHKWAGLHTPKLIGAIECLAHLGCYPTHYQMAVEAKNWATDEKLKGWALYDAGMKHARDASRHLITYAFFGKIPSAK